MSDLLPHEDPDPARPWLDYRGSRALDPAPRRGFPSARAYEPDPAMPGHWATLRDVAAGALRVAVESPVTDPGIAAAMRSYLDGEADALGAAAALETAAAVMSLYDVARRYTQLDAWIDAHGVVFATEALMRQCEIRVVNQHGKHYSRVAWRNETPAVVWAPAKPLGAEWGRGTECRQLRTALSAMPEAEYRRFRDVLEPYGRNHRQRLVRAYLMPTERDWAAEALAEWRERDSKTWSDQNRLAGIASSLDELREAGMLPLSNIGGNAPSVATLVEAFGAECAPEFVASVEAGTREYQGKATIHEVIAGLPHDAAVEYLLKNLVAERTGPLVRAAAERFPRRTLRVIARLAADAEPSLRSRFAHVVASVPALGAAREVAPADVKDAADRLTDLTDAPPEAAALHEFLASPPWTRKATKRKKLVVDISPVGEDGLRWREGERDRWRESTDAVRRGLAETENPAEALAALVKSANGHRALPPLAGPAAARIAADWLVRLRSTRLSVGDWLDRHGLEAALWVAPDAVGKAGKPRKAAEAVLRDVARRFGDAAVLEAVAPYGEAAVASVAEILAVDPLDLDGRKAPKVPEWAEPVLGMPVLLRGRRERLPRASVAHVVAAMALDSPAIPYAGLDIVKEQCDPASLGAFSWAVLESWEINDAPAKDAWALTQLARFADADAVARLEALVREWPDRNHSKRALNGLEVLGAVESEHALRAVHRLTRFRGSKAVKAAAVNQLELVAAGLGLDTEQLADRLVPDTGTAAVAAEQATRLERAMADGRTWAVDEFREHLLAHPLLGELARRLVWQADGTAFRIAEDDTFANAEDDAVELPEGAAIRLAHPVLLGDALDAWVRQLADYEVLQPFDQLGRPAHTAAGLAPLEGRKARTGPLHGLTKSTWHAVRDGSTTVAIERRFRTGTVRAGFSPGYGGGPYFDADAVQVIDAVRFPEGLDAVSFSEAVADLGRAAKA
ncbi:DUF4132 domain-containing protein [Glycomyces sp. NPDC047010]|uniref:DUF4132 domain-containing protein n=1 Tax=Glycomyces sp. NPDC047010 TaxID=3155023 RepID=UPI0033C8702A